MTLEASDAAPAFLPLESKEPCWRLRTWHFLLWIAVSAAWLSLTRNTLTDTRLIWRFWESTSIALTAIGIAVVVEGLWRRRRDSLRFPAHPGEALMVSVLATKFVTQSSPLYGQLINGGFDLVWYLRDAAGLVYMAVRLASIVFLIWFALVRCEGCWRSALSFAALADFVGWVWMAASYLWFVSINAALPGSHALHTVYITLVLIAELGICTCTLHDVKSDVHFRWTHGFGVAVHGVLFCSSPLMSVFS